MQYFGLKDVRDVIVEYRNGVGPSHRQSCESESAEWALEGHEVARGFSDSPFIIADKEVHHSGTGATRELFSELLCKRRNTGMGDSDGVSPSSDSTQRRVPSFFRMVNQRLR